MEGAPQEEGRGGLQGGGAIKRGRPLTGEFPSLDVAKVRQKVASASECAVWAVGQRAP